MQPIATYKDQIGPNSINVKHLSLNSNDLSGDCIDGGTITNFGSTGIKDEATRKVIRVSDNAVVLTTGLKILDGNKEPIFEVDANSIRVKRTLIADNFLENKKSRSPILELNFDNGGLGSGIITKNQLNQQSILYTKNIWEISDSIRLPTTKNITIGNKLALSEKELGSTVVKSNLKSLGVLDELRVRGDFNVDEKLYYSTTTNRLGINTIDPQGVLGLMENGVEFVIRGEDYLRGKLGTATKHDLHLVTNNQTVIKLDQDGYVSIGNGAKQNSKVTINHNNNMDFALCLINTGKGLSITAGKDTKLVIKDQSTDGVTMIVGDGKLGVNVAEPEAALHVAGDINLMNKHMWSAPKPPSEGKNRKGDIVWNSDPGPTQPVGWICVEDGVPGIWAVFGRIESI